MKKTKPAQPIVRRSITLPADLDAFASWEAGQNHCGNISAFLRTLLHAAKTNRTNRKSLTHVDA